MEPSLITRGLSKSYDSLPVLENWNLVVNPGERLAIVGPSGCGKTTFLRLIAGLERPSLGSFTLTCRKSAYVFQEPRLIPWKSVKDNLLFVRPQGPYRSILDSLGLAGFEDHFPAQLSGGMAQRVNLGRALMAEPDFLILDEAFFALDLRTKEMLMKLLLERWEQSHFTLVCVTHDLKDALLLADRIVILSDRPARIKDDYRIDRPADLNFSSPELFQMEAALYRKMMA
jgi:NitT/TauT family transport system ATP-binding protein